MTRISRLSQIADYSGQISLASIGIAWPHFAEPAAAHTLPRLFRDGYEQHTPVRRIRDHSKIREGMNIQSELRQPGDRQIQ